MWTLMILAVSFCNVASIESSLYDEIPSRATCPPLDTCRSFKYRTDDHLWGRRICECGPHCVRFRTCCADSLHWREKYPVQLPQHERCQKLEYFPVPVMMVSKCADGWEWPEVLKRKCENGEHSADDHLFTSIPLTSVGTLTTYRNYFCALCNYGGDDFLYWNVGLTEKGSHKVRMVLQEKRNRGRKKFILNHVVYNTTRKSWVIPDENGTELYEINLRYVLPFYLRKMVKKCYENLIENCTGYHDTFLEQYCHSYYLPIKINVSGSTLIYRNPHCVMCNDVTLPSVMIDHCTVKVSKRAEKRPFSFTLLLDVNTSDGDRVGYTQVPAPDCGKNRIYDPYFKRCTDLTCAPIPGIVFKDGKCVKVD